MTATNGGGSASATSAQTGAVAAASSGGTSGLNGLKASGDEMVDDSGTVVHLHGVNRSGTEYACIQGWGIFDGPSDAASVAGDGGLAREHRPGAAQRGLLAGDQRRPRGLQRPELHQRNRQLRQPAAQLRDVRRAIADLGRARAPQQATYQPNAPDEDHSPAMWTSMAATFKNDPNVILAPWGETTASELAVLHAMAAPTRRPTAAARSTATASCGSGCYYYTSAGMQQAVTRHARRRLHRTDRHPLHQLRQRMRRPDGTGESGGLAQPTPHRSGPQR